MYVCVFVRSCARACVYVCECVFTEQRLYMCGNATAWPFSWSQRRGFRSELRGTQRCSLQPIRERCLDVY